MIIELCQCKGRLFFYELKNMFALENDKRVHRKGTNKFITFIDVFTVMWNACVYLDTMELKANCFRISHAFLIYITYLVLSPDALYEKYYF